MRFKKSKQDVLKELNNLYPYGDTHSLNSSSMSALPSNIEAFVTSMVKQHVKQTMEKLLDSIYTDEEFERDITLK